MTMYEHLAALLLLDSAELHSATVHCFAATITSSGQEAPAICLRNGTTISLSRIGRAKVKITGLAAGLG